MPGIHKRAWLRERRERARHALAAGLMAAGTTAVGDLTSDMK